MLGGGSRASEGDVTSCRERPPLPTSRCHSMAVKSHMRRAVHHITSRAPSDVKKGRLGASCPTVNRNDPAGGLSRRRGDLIQVCLREHLPPCGGRRLAGMCIDPRRSHRHQVRAPPTEIVPDVCRMRRLASSPLSTAARSGPAVLWAMVRTPPRTHRWRGERT